MPNKTLLSVVIPVYNDPEGIEQTLDSLIRQKNAPNYEIIVVDNDSTDETPSVIEEFEENYPDLVFGYSETRIQGSYAARNTGIEQASGDLLAFIDADITVEDTWVADIHDRFHNSNVDYLGCNVEMYIPDGENTFWARYDVAMGLPVEHYLETKQFAPTCALTIRRRVIEEVGTFDQTLVSGGDKEFGKRVYHAEFQIDYDPAITVQHPSRTTFESHLQKARRIGEGQAQLWSRHSLAAHPLSPSKVLPPSPQRIKSRTETSRTPPLVYIIAYFLKLVQTLYSIRELFSRT